MRNQRVILIFDLDGTLVDSNQQIAGSLNNARSDLGFSILPQEFYDENIGLPVDDLMGDLSLNEHQRGKLVTRFREYLTQEVRKGETRVFPGVQEVLESLTFMGIPIAIATNKPTNIAMEVVAHSELAQFEIFVQGVDGFPPKPNPEVIQRVLANFPNRAAIMIGDRSEDMAAAMAANIHSVGIAKGSHSAKLLVEHGASLVFASFDSLAKDWELNWDSISNLV